jgi:FdhD protein
MRAAVSLPCLSLRSAGPRAAGRTLPEEVPVALVFNGSARAVMMATPADLEEFGTGFAVTEGIAPAGEVGEVEVLLHAQGAEVRIWLPETRAGALAARARAAVGPVGCGLCGIESLEQALRPLPPLPPSALTLEVADVEAAVAGLRERQPLHDLTHAAHAAGFFVPGRGLVAVREDVGRHNALDKLAGALLRAGEDPAVGAVVITSRVSVDMVQKTVALGAPALIAVSAPTAQAVRLAEASGLTLVALARGDGGEVFAGAARIRREGAADVA